VRKLVSWAAALIVPAMMLTGPLGGADNNKDKDKDKDSDKPAEKYTKVTTLAGKIMAVYEDKRKIRIQVSVPKVNPQGILNIQNAQLAMARANSLLALLQAKQQMLQAQRSLYTSTNVEIEVQAIDEVVVRTATPREAFDEKGKIKKFTKAELKELRGNNPKLPGYTAVFGDLTADQFIQLSVVRKKGEAAPKPASKPKKKGKDGDLEADALGDDAPLVNMIMILAEPPPSK
jgi:hypothetical protein